MTSQQVQQQGYVGASPETPDEVGAYSVAANNAGVIPPDRVTSPNTPKPAQRSTSSTGA